VIIPPPALAALRQLCHENEILFVADEVITASPCEIGSPAILESDPDSSAWRRVTSVICPRATMLSDEIAEAMPAGAFFMALYSGHPVCAAAAIANLNEIEKLGLIARVKNDLAPYFQIQIDAIRSHPAVAEVRCCGLLGAIELVPREGRDALTPTSMLGLAWSLIREEGASARHSRPHCWPAIDNFPCDIENRLHTRTDRRD
jgi:putrescine aminotransferase